MDLQEWELLPDDGFLEIHDDGGKKIFSRKYGGDPKQSTVFKTNYFICPSQKSQKFSNPPESPRASNQLVPVPIQLQQTTAKSLDHELMKEVTKLLPIELSVVPSVIPDKDKALNIGAVEADQDTVSQVFFKKMKENEFVDMKILDSPKSTGRGNIVPQIDTPTFQFEEREEAMEGKTVTKKNSLDSDTKQKEEKEEEEEEEEVTWEEKNGGLNIWKWSLTGIGAICSFGLAAATICVIIFGNHQKIKQQQQQNQKLQFQIYTDDKRIKQVVHHATKLNEAISAVRGVPLTSAHINIGGYYEGL